MPSFGSAGSGSAIFFRGVIVKKGFFGATSMMAAAALIVAMPSQSLGQTNPTPTASPTPVAMPSAPPPSAAETQARRRNIRYMEGVLVQAIRVGAEQVGKELESYDPTGITVLLGVPRARGFVIDQHGVFFDVEVPDMNQSVVAGLMVLQRDRQLSNAADSLRAAVRAMPEGTPLQQVQMALQTLSSYGPSTKDSVVGQNVQGQPAPAILSDPRQVYREAVVNSVIDAMLGYSVQMSLGPDEWLTVAARGVDSAGPLQGLQETTTITVKVKGSDLATYHSDPSRRAEIRQKVKADVKVF